MRSWQVAHSTKSTVVEENPSGNEGHVAGLDPRYKHTVHKTNDVAQAVGWTRARNILAFVGWKRELAAFVSHFSIKLQEATTGGATQGFISNYCLQPICTVRKQIQRDNGFNLQDL